MALSRKPKTGKKAKVEADEVTELILKGGSSPDDLLKKETTKKDIVYVQLRISSEQLEKVDALVKERPGKLSRHTWIMEAIAEKIKRDND